MAAELNGEVKPKKQSKHWRIKEMVTRFVD